jgi:cellulose 1,4-beta-cellobiosidase
MAGDETYQTFALLGNEFTFDVDASQLPCGLNGALYFVSMDGDGGRARFTTNAVGAKFGTGYCDAQCPHDVHFVDGEVRLSSPARHPPPDRSQANLDGTLGTCCPEMDVWEANSISTAFTAHPCLLTYDQTECDGASCSLCDKAGCDFNPYRQGNKTFYGPGPQYTIDSTKKITVVTQFVSLLGVLTDIKRLYVQNGRVIANSATKVPAVGGNSINTLYCPAQKLAFGDPDTFTLNGGLVSMGAALSRPMVLAMSLWDDGASNMLWLDSD